MRITLRWNSPIIVHLLSRHGIGMVRDMGIYYNSTTWDVTMPQHFIVCHMGICYHATA
ncbi:hypothetical protein [Prevotella sp. HJM029]|uniref:hypothetical protein n=1 Tax=Prevotella sp. HJM029 TaxID=1433844 RepID=UPI0012DDE528|nr:hypothetical protein [Prevotella sp. HJM029]